MITRKQNQGVVGRINAEIIDCAKCPRLVRWREESAGNPPARYAGESYWARPVPGFGDPAARLLVVGLAPAAHGGNRTGRMFTGDRSGDWLFRALHKSAFCNQPVSKARGDGLVLKDCYVSAVVRCAPPANKPAPQERDNCVPYLTRELEALSRLKVIVALGAFAWKGALLAARAAGKAVPVPKVKFGHGAKVSAGDLVIIGSFHPSQQNTFTGKLTEPAFDSVFRAARSLLDP